MRIEELNVIKQAIINEIEGYEFYKMAAAQTEIPEVREAYISFAEEEFQHVEWLKKLFKSMEKDEVASFDLAFAAEADSPHLFDWSKLDRKTAGLALSVFGIGIQMERAAVAFYKEAAGKTQFASSKSLYEKLVVWEQAHLNHFAEQYDTLKEEWWADQGFEPF